jgi:CBS domain-containing protein
MPINSVKQILQSKGDEVWTVAPSGAVLDAVKLMAEKGIGALLVMEGGEVVGIISERDVARKVVLIGGSPADTRVDEIMTKRVYTASLDETAEECLAVMTEMRIRHLPVVDGRRVVGVVSIGDLVKAVISHQRFMIEQLTNYIGQ